VVSNKQNLSGYEPTSCALQYAADKPCTPPSAAAAGSTKSLAAELARRAATGSGGAGAALTDAGNIYTETPPPPLSGALRRCQSLVDTATAASTGPSSWQRAPAAVTSSAQHHSTCKLRNPPPVVNKAIVDS